MANKDIVTIKMHVDEAQALVDSAVAVIGLNIFIPVPSHIDPVKTLQAIVKIVESDSRIRNKVKHEAENFVKRVIEDE